MTSQLIIPSFEKRCRHGFEQRRTVITHSVACPFVNPDLHASRNRTAEWLTVLLTYSGVEKNEDTILRLSGTPTTILLYTLTTAFSPPAFFQLCPSLRDYRRLVACSFLRALWKLISHIQTRKPGIPLLSLLAAAFCDYARICHGWLMHAACTRVRIQSAKSVPFCKTET
jgi:hypothetical protein